MVLHVDVISDVICPWCSIGKRWLEKARQTPSGFPFAGSCRPVHWKMGKLRTRVVHRAACGVWEEREERDGRDGAGPRRGAGPLPALPPPAGPASAASAPSVQARPVR